eukprot:1161405-Pelagomonas_calceolata.AAC.8
MHAHTHTHARSSAGAGADGGNPRPVLPPAKKAKVVSFGKSCQPVVTGFYSSFPGCNSLLKVTHHEFGEGLVDCQRPYAPHAGHAALGSKQLRQTRVRHDIRGHSHTDLEWGAISKKRGGVERNWDEERQAPALMHCGVCRRG